MGAIIALGLAAAVYPQLLAVVVVILTRPNPQPLLWACYMGSLCVGAACGVAVLIAFRDRDSLLGTTSRSLGAATYLILGAIALLCAGLVATRRGRELLGRDRPRGRWRRRRQPDAHGSVQRATARAELALEKGSLGVAVVVGAVLGIPGPFDFVALGRIATGTYATIEVIGLTGLFIVLKLLLMLPTASYAIDAEGTAARVERFAARMKANKHQMIAAVVAVVGAVLIVRGISGLG